MTELRNASVNKKYLMLLRQHILAMLVREDNVKKGIQQNIDTATVFNTSFKKRYY